MNQRKQSLKKKKSKNRAIPLAQSIIEKLNGDIFVNDSNEKILFHVSEEIVYTYFKKNKRWIRREYVKNTVEDAVPHQVGTGVINLINSINLDLRHKATIKEDKPVSLVEKIKGYLPKLF